MQPKRKRAAAEFRAAALVAGEEHRVTLSFSSFITPAIAAHPVYTYILASRRVITPSHLSR